ncbi:YgfZ/GcvT domain-containing protein [Methyloraptor flagellatus]|uniref:Folate-binding protein n=1 Tax=Methyloraptor flagellatus TaxID=3162530 RepID=A0AAU7X6L3_9HYPH
MAAGFVAVLEDRGVVAVEGPEAVSFLDGLVTSDVEKLAPGEAAFAALLTPQGKILFDFLPVRTAEGYLIDTPRALAADLAKRLGFYKLRAKVTVADRSEIFGVIAGWATGGAAPALDADGVIAYADPRHADLGRRAIVPRETMAAVLAGLAAELRPEADYETHRIGLGVPKGGLDFAYGDAFPHDADMDDLAGVDFTKGCYVGQEVVSRMKHRGTARRRVIQVAGVDGAALPAAGTEIVAQGKPVGTVGSAVGADGLALVRLDRVKEAIDAGAALAAGDVALEPRLPAFARFGWPAPAAD